jgi:hypothetical protein
MGFRETSRVGWGNEQGRMGGGWDTVERRAKVCVLGVVWGKLRGRENHTLLPQFRTVCETVWGLGLNPCGESLGPCGEDDGSKSESGRGIASASLDPPRHRPPEECVRDSEEDLGLG